MPATEPEHRVEIMSDISALLPKELLEKNTPPPFLPCQPTVPMTGFEGQMRNKRERHRHLQLTGSNRPWEEQGGGGGGAVWGVAH